MKTARLARGMRAIAATATLFATVLGFSGPVQADPSYPNRMIRIVVPFSAGGATDVLARVIGEHLQKAWGQTVIVENRTGSGGNIGAASVAKADPDGYTILMGAIGPSAVNASLYKNMPYDTAKDFAPITQVASLPMLLVVHKSVNANNVKELIARAKNGKDKLNIGTAGVGASQHLAALLFENMTGVKFENVGYKGASAMVPDLLSGAVHLTFGDIVSLSPHLKNDQIKAIALTTAERSPTFPDLPTIAESGVPGYSAAAWYGLFAPAGTPPAIVEKIQKEVAAFLKTPAALERMKSLGAEAVGSDPETFRKFVLSEMERWGKVVQAANIKLD